MYLKTRVLDSWAILEWSSGRQPATDFVDKLLFEAQEGIALLVMSAINVGEVYYLLLKRDRRSLADEWRDSVYSFPITIEVPTKEEIWNAARMKGRLPISYADAFAAALAQKYNCAIVTGDPDFHRVGGLEVDWIGRTESTQSDNSELPS